MVTVRAENSDDIAAVRRVNEVAFGGPNEAALVDALRKAADPYISLVAIESGQVVGHIFFSPVSIESQDILLRAMGLAPMAVLPGHQNRGVGSLLVQEGLRECERIGCDLIVVVGHPEYYPRFGFVQANQKGLQCAYPVPAEAFMVTELKPGALTGKQGLVKYRPEFDRVSEDACLVLSLNRLYSLVFRVASCDFVDRVFPPTESDPRNHMKKHETQSAFLSFMKTSEYACLLYRYFLRHYTSQEIDHFVMERRMKVVGRQNIRRLGSFALCVSIALFVFSVMGLTSNCQVMRREAISQQPAKQRSAPAPKPFLQHP